jgi:hypothetical protein
LQEIIMATESTFDSQLYPMAQHIEVWAIGKLIPFARNPRTHSDAQVAQIAGSIAAFGFNAPILVDSHAGVIAGHGRLLAARQLGLEQVPVIVLDHLSEIQKRAYVLADNKLSELGGYDDEVLRRELAELRDAEIDLGGLASATTSCGCCWRTLISQVPKGIRKSKSPRLPRSR